MAEGDFDALRAVAPAAGSEERGTRLDTAVVQTLDSSVSDLIRAAQVLPSLSIVVEELVNNALDAGASKVSVSPHGMQRATAGRVSHIRCLLGFRFELRGRNGRYPS